MTIQQAITRTDSLKPNQYSDEQKIEWLSELDGRIMEEIISPRSGEKTSAFKGYNKDTDTNTQLLAEEPYSRLYVLYLCSQIDFGNAEYTRYNNSAMAFNEAYESFFGYYNRTHMHKDSGIFKR